MKWPRTLASRLALIFFTGLVLAYGLSFGLQAYERYISSRSMMLSNLEQDVATSVAILDRLPAAERAAWLPRLERRTYRYRLDQGLAGEAMPSSDPPMAAASIVKAIGSDYRLTFLEIPGPNAHFQAHLKLADGAPLTIDVTPAPVPVARWLPVVLLIQLAVLLLCTWLAVRLAIGPLTRLAQAVDNLDPDQPGVQLDESGPREVRYAAVAFNALQARIAAHLKERMQLLAAISHDLQTPITRMKLRVEVMDEGSKGTSSGATWMKWNTWCAKAWRMPAAWTAAPKRPAGSTLMPFSTAWYSTTRTAAPRSSATAAAIPCWKPARMRCAGYW